MNKLDLIIVKNLLNHRKHALEFATECNEKILDPDLWRFVKLITEYVKVYKEVPTKNILLERNKKSSAIVSYIEKIYQELERIECDEKEYKYHLEQVKNRFSEKLVLNLRESISDQSFDLKKSLSEIQSVISNIKGLQQRKAYTQKSLKEAIPEFLERYKGRKSNPEQFNGILTGYSFLDYTLGGIMPGTLTLVCGFTGGGKSTLLMNLALNMWLNGNSIHTQKNWREGHDVLYFSLEMGYEMCQERVLSRLAMLPQKSIRDAKLTEEEEMQLSKVLKFVDSYHNQFDIVDLPRNSTLETIEAVYNEISGRRQRAPKIVVVDYLSLMASSNDDEDDWLKLGKSAEHLHEFARVYDSVVLTAAQLNEPRPGNKRSEGEYGLGSVSRSRMINQNCDLILSIERRDRENERPDLPLHIIKSRSSEHSSGILSKDFSRCAILNDPNYNTTSQLGDISNIIET